MSGAHQVPVRAMHRSTVRVQSGGDGSAAVPPGSVLRFATPSLVGFIRHTATGFSALSGICTHMGCSLWWNSDARTFDCPCHGGRFAENGWSAKSSPIAYRRLPQIETKVEDGHVWAYVPTTGSPTSAGAAGVQRSGTYHQMAPQRDEPGK